MKQKTIEKIIKTKIIKWVETIDDKELREEIKQSVVVTGGCIASMLLNEDVKDFDIYFSNIDVANKVTDYYLKMFQKINDKRNIRYYKEEHSDGRGLKIVFNNDKQYIAEKEDNNDISGFFGEPVENVFEDVFDTDIVEVEENDQKPQYRPIFVSPNAITLSNKIQLITRFCGTPDEIHENFDFVHCTNYFTFDKGLVLNKDAMASLLTKELKYIGSLYPVCSLLRTKKYLLRGFSVNAGLYLKIILQIQKLDLMDTRVLKEQLIGVDSAYFLAMLRHLKKSQEDDTSIPEAEKHIVQCADKLYDIIEKVFNT
jgi:hypothetical protein